MGKILLTKDLLNEIFSKRDDDETMEYYFQKILDLEAEIEAYQYGAFVALMLCLLDYKQRQLFEGKDHNFYDFFGLENFNVSSPYWQYHQMLVKTRMYIAYGLLNNENLPDKELAEFSERHASFCFQIGAYLACLSYCQNTLARDPNNAFCNFIKASIIELCLIIKTPQTYKIALLNYQKALLDKCDLSKIGLAQRLVDGIANEINTRHSVLSATEKTISLTLISPEQRLTPEFEFYFFHQLLLNPLAEFDKFAVAGIEDFEPLNIGTENQNLFNSIVDDYKLCRLKTFLYYEEIIDKRDMCASYSYAYSIFDKIAFLIKKVLNLEIPDDKVYFNQTLFDAKIAGTNQTFGKLKNNTIVPLYLLMKAVREKNRIKTGLDNGTYEHNETRNAIDHKSIVLVEDDVLKRNSTLLLNNVRNAILYTAFLLHNPPTGADGEITATGIIAMQVVKKIVTAFPGQVPSP